MENFSYNRFFSVQLLENVRNFVVEKGGAFVMLGGVNSYGKGGYKGTAIEDILPVEFAGIDRKKCLTKISS